MKELYNLDLIKSTIVQIAALHGISRNDMERSRGLIGEENWSLNYQQDNEQKNFEQIINDCIKYNLLYRTAKSNNDWLVTLSGLMRTGDCIQRLSQLFSSFANDLNVVMKNSRLLVWPEIPDELNWPDDYRRRLSPLHATKALNFDLIRGDIVSIAALHGIRQAAMQYKYRQIDCPNWHWDYSSDHIQTYFDRNLNIFHDGVDLYNRAVKKDDLENAYNGLIFAMNAAQDLSIYLNSGYHDIGLVILNSNNFTWPTFPDNYRLPHDYVPEMNKP